MATSYSKVYEAFIFKVEAYHLLELIDTDREEIIHKYMIAVCRKNQKKIIKYVDIMDRDDTLQQFNNDLDDEIIDIIAECMISEWLKPKIYSDELLESRLNTKDFSEFSPAKLIEHTRYVYEMSCKESLVLINNYTFSHEDVGELNKV